MTDSAGVNPSGERPEGAVATLGIARFGVYEVDLGTGELRRSGVRVKLQEQPFQLLAFLLARPGEVVSRDEIREKLWPTDFVDFDNSLNTAVRKLRAALDDAADNPRFVETLARRGYRFIAPVTMIGGPARNEAVPVNPLPSSTPTPLVSEPAAPRRPSRAIAAVLAFALIALATFLVVRYRDSKEAPQAVVRAIAVLPFINENADTEHVSDGISEILIDTLSRVTDLRVMGRTTVFRFKGQPFDPKKIGRELNVAAVVIGTVRGTTEHQTIHVELIDTRDGSQMWGQQYQTGQSSLPAVQSRISDDLAARLRRGLEHGGSSTARYSKNPQAYELYLKGLQAWNRRRPEELRRAVALFKEATELDPNFAEAYAGLAQTYGVMVGGEMLPASEGTTLVLNAARKALALDPENSDAYASMATSKFRNLWDFEGAGADYKRSLALNPSNATAHQWYADYLRTMGRYEESSAEAERAWMLDPSARAFNSARCTASLGARKYEEAVARVHQAELLGAAGNQRCLVAALVAMGDLDGALSEMTRTSMSQPIMAEWTRVYRESGPEGYFREQLKILRAGQARHADVTMDIAEAQAILGDTDGAFATLEDAFRRRISQLTQFHYMPTLDSLRPDPRFEDLARRIGLPPEALAAADVIRNQRPFDPGLTRGTGRGIGSRGR